MQIKLYLLASLPFITSVFSIPQIKSLPIDLEKLKLYCPDLLDATSEALNAGLNGIRIPGVANVLQLWTSVDIVNAYNKRVAETKATLNAVIELNPDAVSFAGTLDAERKAGRLRGPLHGLPILIKDTISTGDRMNSTSGSYALLGAQADESTISKKLRAAGVIVLGKANLAQWSSLRTLVNSSGWSARGGQTLGAYCPNQDPKGSSSGSGVAASVGLAWATLGIETLGSIILPSSYNNIVGIKPTVGLTSRYLTIGSSPRQDSVGPMARTVSDAAALLQVIAGKDSNDPYTLQQPFTTPPNYMKALNKDSLKGKRIGIPRNAAERQENAAVEKAVNDAFNEAIKVIKAAGAIVVDNANFSSAAEVFFEADNPTFGFPLPDIGIGIDFYAELPKYTAKLKTNPNNITDLKSLAAYTKRVDDLEGYDEFDIGIWEAILAFVEAIPEIRQGSPQFAAQITDVISRWANEDGIIGAMAKYNVQGFILPSGTGYLFPGLGGLPVVTVPMGKFPAGTPTIPTSSGRVIDIAPNLPIGLSFFAEKWSEEKLIGWAYAFEQKTQWRRKVAPVVKPKTQLWDVIKLRR